MSSMASGEISSQERTAPSGDRPILVTGATGYLASHVVHQLLDRGYKVRGTVRSLKSPKTAFLVEMAAKLGFKEEVADDKPEGEEGNVYMRKFGNLELIEIDLLSDKNWDKAVEDCEYILHLASPFTFNFKNDDELLQPAIQGVEHLYQNAFKYGEHVKRIVHTSSTASIHYGHSPDRYKPLKKTTQRTASHQERLETTLTSDPDHTNDDSKRTDNSPDTTSANTPAAENTKPLNKRADTIKPKEKKANVEKLEYKLFDETEWSVVDKIAGYEKSKTAAEKRAWELINRHNEIVGKGPSSSVPEPKSTETGTNTDGGVAEKKEEDFPRKAGKVELVVINPSFIFGPILDKCHEECESSTHLRRILLRQYPMVPDMGCGHVDVRDVALAHIKAATYPSDKVAFQRFIISADDGNLTFSEQGKILYDYFHQFGYNPPTAVAPHFMVAVGKYFLQSVKAASDKLQMCFVTNKKSHDVLDMEYRSAQEALRDHALSMMSLGVLDKKKTPKEVIDAVKAY